MTKATWTIAKKELKGYIDRPAAYILLVVFVAITLFLFFRSAFLSGEASLRPLFDMLPWVLLFFIPPITMRLLAEEDNQGTMEILLTQPISDLDVIAGKFLGALAFVKIALALTLPVAITLRIGGPIDYGIVVAQYFGAVLLAGVLVAIGLFTSGVTKNQVVASIIAITIGFVLLIMSNDVVLLAAPGLVGQILQTISPMTHFEDMTRGVIELRDVIYFVSVIAGFGALAFLSLKRKKMNRASPGYANLQSGVAIIIGIAILANVLVGYVGGRLDLTSSKLFSLSPATVSMLRDLNDVVTVKLYASPDLPGQMALTFRDTKDLLGDYSSTSSGKVQVQTLYPQGEDTAAQDAQSAGIQPVQFNVLAQDEFQVKRGYLGIAMQFAGKKEVIPFVQRTDDLEYQVTSLIRKLTIKDRKTVGFLSGSGEKTLSQDMPALQKELEKQYETKDVPSGGKKPLDLDGVDTLVVVGPTKKVPTADRDRITQFLGRGGKALFLIDQVAINPQFMMGTPNPNSLADYVATLGVRVNQDMIYDLRAGENVSFPGGGGVQVTIPYPLWPRVGVASQAVAGNIQSVVLPWPSSVEATKGVRASEVLKTSPDAGVQTDAFNITPDQQFSTRGLKSRLAGVALTAVGPGKRGRIVVVGDADFVTDQFAKNSPENMSFAANSIDWLSGQQSLAGIRSKRSQPNKLEFGSDATREAVKYGNLVGIPLLVILYGVFHLVRRRRISRQGYAA